MIFKFYNYEFEDQYDKLISYLNVNSIEYKMLDNLLVFQIKNENCNKPIDVHATVAENRITRLQLKCYPISFMYRKRIELELDNNYNLINKEYNASIRTYDSGEYAIVVNNPESLLIDVQFELVTSLTERKEAVKHYKAIALFTAIGLVLSVAFIALYFSFKSLVSLHVFTSIVSLAYGLFQFFYLYLRKSMYSKNTKLAICIVIPIIYFALVIITSIFMFIRIGDPDIFSERFIFIDVLMVLIYMVPSFHIVLLLLAGLAYA